MKWETWIFLVFFTAFGLEAIAETTDGMMVRIQEGPGAKTLYVQLANLQEQKTRIEILDEEGRTWYRESLNENNGFSILLHLDKVPEATYLLKVWNRRGQEARMFRVDAQHLYLFELEPPAPAQSGIVRDVSLATPGTGKLISYFTPKKGSRLHIQLANLQEQGVFIEFGDYRQPGWMTETIRDAQGYSKAWNLDGLRDGLYYFLIETKEQVLVQEVRLEEGRVALEDRQRLMKEWRN